MVHRPDGRDQVVGIVDVAEGAPGDLVVVVHVAVGVDDHDQLRQRQQPGPPDRVHHLLRVLRITLLDGDDAAVVEHPRLRQVIIDDLGDHHPDQRQEDPFGGLAHRTVLLRRPTDHDRLEHRVTLRRHHVDVQRRERFDGGVEAGVVAERPLGQPLPRLEPALEHHLCVRGHPQRDGEAVDHLHPLAAQVTGEQVLVEVGGQWRGRGVGDRRVAPERDRDRQPLPTPLGDRVMRVGVLVDLPVHADGACVVALQPVHPEVARPGLGVLRVRQTEVEEGPAVVRPGVHPRQPEQVDVRTLENDVLAGRGPDPAGRDRGERRRLAERLAQPGQADRQLRAQQRAEPFTDVVQRLDAERGSHPLLGAEHVDRQRHVGAGRGLEQQSRPALPYHPGHDLGDLETRVDGYGDAAQILPPFEMSKERTQIRPGHDLHPRSRHGWMPDRPQVVTIPVQHVTPRARPRRITDRRDEESARKAH